MKELSLNTLSNAKLDKDGTAINSLKVNGFTVETNVPVNAKFTDTIYTHPDKHPAGMITQDENNRFVTDIEKATWNDKLYKNATAVNSLRVNGLTVETAVPVGAKFTDTIYTHPDNHPANMITTDANNRFVTDTEKAAWNNKLDKDGTAVNALKVNGLTVETSVPASAKFTDTIYTHPSSHSATMITTDVNNRFVTDAEKSVWNNKLDKDATAINALKVNNFTVETNVPADAKFTDTIYTHPTTAGYKHIPTGGASGQILKYSANGTAIWANASSGKKTVRVVIGTSTAGWTSEDCDYLCNGSNDQTIINNAISSLPTNGGEVILLDGTYNITASIKIEKNNISLIGNGNSTILNRMFNSTYTGKYDNLGIVYVSGLYCEIKNIMINGNKESYKSSFYNYGVVLYGATRHTPIYCKIFNIKIVNTNNVGIKCQSISCAIFTNIHFQDIGDFALTGDDSSNLIYSNNKVIDCTNGGAHFYGGNYIIVTNNRIKGGSYGVDFSDTIYYSVISNNVISNSNYGISLTSESSLNQINGNICVDCNLGIYVEYVENGNVITGNNFSNNKIGISLYEANNTIISDNVCNNNTNEGISIEYSNGSSLSNNITNNCLNGIVCSNCNEINITNNTSNGCYRGIRSTNVNRSNITGNNVYNSSYASLDYPIEMLNCNNCLVTSNLTLGKNIYVVGGSGITQANNKI